MLMTRSLQQYFELRSRQIQRLRETQSPNPYPHKFEVSRSLTSYVAKYGAEGVIKPGEKVGGVTEALAGRIHSMRSSSQKLRFYDLHSEGKKVQIMAALQLVLTASLRSVGSPDCIQERQPTKTRSSRRMIYSAEETSLVSLGRRYAPRQENSPSHLRR